MRPLSSGIRAWPLGDPSPTPISAWGDSFLETVSPTDLAWERSTTQTRLLERHGDCGYMAIVQVPDIAVASRSMAIQGSGRGIVAGSWNVCPGSPGSGLAGVESGPYELGEPLPKHPGTVSGVNVQFDPRDFGTLAEIQENWPGHDEFPRNKGAYFPAGNTWQNDDDAAAPRRGHHGLRRGGDRATAWRSERSLPEVDNRTRGGMFDRSRTAQHAPAGRWADDEVHHAGAWWAGLGWWVWTCGRPLALPRSSSRGLRGGGRPRCGRLPPPSPAGRRLPGLLGPRQPGGAPPDRRAGGRSTGQRRRSASTSRRWSRSWRPRAS